MSVPRFLIAGVMLFCFFSSCNKVDPPVVGEKLLAKVVAAYGDTIVYSSFQYDAQKRLVATIDSSNNGWNSITTFEYDTTGNLIKFTVSGNSNLLVYSDGKVVQKFINGYSGNKNPSSFILSNTYSYDNKGRLVRDSTSDGYTDFTYNDNDDVVQTHVLVYQTGIVVGDMTITDTYDSSINPYVILGTTYYFVTNSVNLLSKHNATQEIIVQKNAPTLTTKYTYEYENGLPKKVTGNSDSGGPQAVSIINFYYN